MHPAMDDQLKARRQSSENVPVRRIVVIMLVTRIKESAVVELVLPKFMSSCLTFSKAVFIGMGQRQHNP
jgi:hypothetical protein